MENIREMKNLLPKDLLKEVDQDYELSNSFSDENHKIFDAPSSNEDGLSIKNLDTVSNIIFKKQDHIEYTKNK